MTDPIADPVLGVDIAPPQDASLELARLERSVRAQIFGGAVQPTRIGRFRLLECIGRGGMGVVWSAHDDELDRTVAIKLLRPEFSARDVTGEARALARLSHPNVVGIFDVGEHEDQRFIAMEYVVGQTLAAWLRTPRHASELLAMFLEAGRGLAAAHQVGLVHRDFKPDNVLVGDDGRPRVLDFGLARAPDAAVSQVPAIHHDADPFSTTMTQAGLLVGTPAYMAPEQHLGEAADARSDQFAFAVALFEGLAGRLPFPGDDLRTLSLSVVRGRWDPPSDGTVPAPVLPVLSRALRVDPAERFGDLDALLEALRVAMEPVSDPRFDTQGTDRVLARAAALSAAGSSRPGLTSAEIEEVAAEAGIDPAFARQAALEDLRSPPMAPAQPVAIRPTPVAPGPPPRIAVRRTLPRLFPAVVEVLIREMDRREGKGALAALGASTTWQTPRTELHLDPTPEGTALVLLDTPSLLARTRAWRYAPLGVMLAVATVVPLAVEVFGDFEGLIVLIIFASMGFGGWLGTRVAARVDAWKRAQALSRLSEAADRLKMLAEANSPGVS